MSFTIASLNISIEESRRQEYLYRGIEIILAVSIILLLTSFNLKEVPIYRVKAQLINAISLVSAHQKDYAQYYMETGHWPPAKRLMGDIRLYDSRVVDSIFFDGSGGFHVKHTDKVPELAGLTLSFVAAIQIENPMSSLLWNCGNSLPPQGFVLQSENHTDIPDEYMTASCSKVSVQNQPDYSK